MIRRRRKGVAIVETQRGILVVSGRSKIFSLPGGGAEKWESREKAAMRELFEETGLRSSGSVFLFSYRGRVWRDSRGRKTRNFTKVFKIEVEGDPKPRHEIKYIDFWTPDSNVRITRGTSRLIEKYNSIKK